MVESIGSASTMQSAAVQSAKPTENAETQDVSAKNQPVEQTRELRKRDRFERSSEVIRNGSPDSFKARAAYDKEHSTARYDRFEYGDNSYVNSDDGAKAQDMSETVDTNRLYQYTDTELKDFLLDGSITQSEYNAEVSKRSS